MDFADWWDKWPGQYDPYMSALETYHAGGVPWREVIDQKAPRMVIRSNMNRWITPMGWWTSAGFPRMPTAATRRATATTFWFTESVLGGAIRFFYNGRVFWNDCDGIHVYRFNADHGTNGRFNYGQGKVVANFQAMAGNTIFVSEAFDEKYPDDRIELLKRISPPTMDVSYPVDLFVANRPRSGTCPSNGLSESGMSWLFSITRAMCSR